MITHTETIDHENPLAKKIYNKVLRKWRSDCVKSVVSRKSLQKGGRTLRREIMRRGCKVEEDETDDTMTMTFIDKGTIKGRLTISFENIEPEPVE